MNFLKLKGDGNMRKKKILSVVFSVVFVFVMFGAYMLFAEKEE